MSEYCKNCKILQDKLDIALKALKDIDFVSTHETEIDKFVYKVNQIKELALQDLKKFE